MIVVAITIGIFGIHLNKGLLYWRKVQHQKDLDGIALEYGTQFARGLNTLAALNQALSIAKQRAYLMAATYTSLAACSPTPICIRALSRLTPKIKPFFRKIRNLGENLRDKQEQIMTWMIQVQCQFSQRGSNRFEAFRFYPNFCGQPVENLPFTRLASKDIDVVRCKDQKFHHFFRFKSAASRKSLHGRIVSNEIIVEYTNSTNDTSYFIKPTTNWEVQKLSPYLQKDRHRYIFSQGKIKVCKKFSNLWKKIEKSLPLGFQLPEPLELTKKFFNEQNKTLFLASTNRIYFDEKEEKSLWGLSEIKVKGENLSKMKFASFLHSISLEKQLWKKLNSDFRHNWPNLSSFENEIYH